MKKQIHGPSDPSTGKEDQWNGTVQQTVSIVSREPPLVAELVAFDFTVFGAGDYCCPLHIHPYFQLDIVLEGKALLQVEEKVSFVARKGEGLLIPPLLKHGSASRKGFVYGSFKFHLLPRYAPLFGPEPRKVRFNDALLSSLRVPAKLHRAGAPLAGLHAVSVLTQCLIEIQGVEPVTADLPKDLAEFRFHLWPVLERIAQAPYAGWPVRQLAGECHVSHNYFSSLFRRLFRQTPAEYLLQARMREAARELTAGDGATIKAVAAKSGYQTVHSFSRAFKRVFGVSPGNYRDRMH
ncbi:MAG: helix-turn-helix domain-containing protein [Verrucomicrobiae bacterium]|nr:helix-turn-helix domain-containing protein [Verrucomicrobiae bacterium]